MVQLIAALFFSAALFAAIGVIAVTLQKSGSQILSALRGAVPHGDIPQTRPARKSVARNAMRLRPTSTQRLAA